jgi:hypothetical protein
MSDDVLDEWREEIAKSGSGHYDGEVWQCVYALAAEVRRLRADLAQWQSVAKAIMDEAERLRVDPNYIVVDLLGTPVEGKKLRIAATRPGVPSRLGEDPEAEHLRALAEIGRLAVAARGVILEIEFVFYDYPHCPFCDNAELDWGTHAEGCMWGAFVAAVRAAREEGK